MQPPGMTGHTRSRAADHSVHQATVGPLFVHELAERAARPPAEAIGALRAHRTGQDAIELDLGSPPAS
jgi:hypothetical protein